MKKRITLLMALCIILSMSACESEPSNAERQSTTEETVSLNEFCSDISGIYVNLDTATEDAFEFMDARNGTISFGVFPGELSRAGTIKDVVSMENDSYEIILYYPEEEWYGDIEPEIEEKHTVVIKSKTFQFKESETLWTYIGNLPEGSNDFSDIMSLVQQRIRKDSQENEHDGGASSMENMTGKELMSLHPDGWKTKEYVESFGTMTVLRWHNTYTFADSSLAYTDAQMQTISDYLVQRGIEASEECYMDGINSISVKTVQQDSDGNIIYTRTTSIQYVPATPSEPIIREW